jgi:hypothetical protein
MSTALSMYGLYPSTGAWLIYSLRLHATANETTSTVSETIDPFDAPP